MNNKNLMWLLLIAGAYYLYTKSAFTPQPKPVTTDPANAGLHFDPLTGGWCYPSDYSGPMIGPYPNC